MGTKKEVNRNRVELQKHRAVVRDPDYERDYDRLRELGGDKERRELIEAFIHKSLQYQLDSKKLKGSKNIDKREQLDIAFQMDYEDHHKKLNELQKKVREPLRTRQKSTLLQNMIEKWGNPFPFPGDENYVFPSPYSPWLIVNDRGRKGDKLNLTIDLRLTESEIIEGVRLIIKKHKPTPKNRNKESIFEPFSVYDMHVKENLNFVDIARRLVNIDGQTKSVDSRLRAYTKQVERAYKKAIEMIKASSLHPSK
jgi:hypothetical protein